MTQPYMTLANGLKMPAIGLGTWNLGQAQTEAAVLAALRGGYRHIDCAPIYDVREPYGRNQREVGRAISKAMADGVVAREDVWITSKLWNTFHETQHVRPALLKSLEELQVNYLDCFLIHWPMAFEFTGYDLKESTPIDAEGNPRRARVTLIETWREMEKLVDEGLVRTIGVCNFPVVLLWDLLGGARIPPAINQVECNPKNACKELARFCKSNNVTVTAYSPFGSTFAPVLELPEIKQIAEKCQRSEANIVIRWAIQRGMAVLAKSWREDRIVQNLTQSTNFVLEEDDIEKIGALDAKQRSLDFSEEWGVDVWA